MNRAHFSDGSTVLYDQFQVHGDKVLFYRQPIGLVLAKQQREITSIEENVSNNPKNGGKRAA